MKKFIVLLWIGLLAAFLPADCAAAVKLACLGDSITAGMGVKKEDCWVSRIAKTLDRKAEVGNFGVSARCLLFKGDRPITREKAYQDALCNVTANMVKIDRKMANSPLNATPLHPHCNLVAPPLKTA